MPAFNCKNLQAIVIALQVLPQYVCRFQFTGMSQYEIIIVLFYNANSHRQIIYATNQYLRKYRYGLLYETFLVLSCHYHQGCIPVPPINKFWQYMKIICVVKARAPQLLLSTIVNWTNMRPTLYLVIVKSNVLEYWMQIKLKLLG